MKRLSTIVTLVLTASMVLMAVPTALATVNGKDGRIAFRRFFNKGHTRGAIFTINPDGTGIRQVTHSGPGLLDTEPDWSPNGRWIVYTAYRRGNEDDSRIHKIRPDGTNSSFLGATCTGSCLSDGLPAWSPSGRRIAFQRTMGPELGQNNLIAIFVMRADGTHARQVTQRGASSDQPNRDEDLAPQWSPSADRLVFERADHERGHHAIFTMRLDGKGLRRLTPWKLDGSQPDWSPDGRWIAFRSQEQSTRRGDIFLVRPNGSGLHRITRGAGKWLSCSFSPNGKEITAAHFPGQGEAGAADVYVMSIDGTDLRNVTRSNKWESTPDWGPLPN